MKLEDAKLHFIQSWGSLATQWGINKTMAQIHALLIISSDPLSQDDMMSQLAISRGNVNMNIRELISWGLVQRVVAPGKRREFFSAEKDVWKITKIVIRERKKRELDPLIKTLDDLQQVSGDKRDRDTRQFLDTVQSIRKFAAQADSALELVIRSDDSWFWSKMLKVIK